MNDKVEFEQSPNYSVIVGHQMFEDFLRGHGYPVTTPIDIRNYYEPDRYWPRNLFTFYKDQFFINPNRPESTRALLSKFNKYSPVRSEYGNGGRVLPTSRLIIAQQNLQGAYGEQVINDLGFTIDWLPLLTDKYEFDRSSNEFFAAQQVVNRTKVSGDFDSEISLIENSSNELLLLTSSSYYDLYEKPVMRIVKRYGLRLFIIPPSEEEMGAASIPILPDGKVVITKQAPLTIQRVKDFLGSNNVLIFPRPGLIGIGGGIRCMINNMKL